MHLICVMVLSIITISFNNLAGLKKTAESVICQSFNDYEWIVVDGGSSDGTREYLQEISENIDWWCSEVDGGIYNAMNKGIAKAHGDYCFFLNSGDYLTDKYSLQRAMDYNFTEDIVWGYLLLNREGKQEKVHSYSDITLRTFIEDTIHHTGNAFIRRVLFSEAKYGLYDEQLKIVSDWKWFLQAIGLGNASGRYIDTNMSVFDSCGISETHPELVLKEREKVLNELIPDKILKDYKQMHIIQEKLDEMRISFNSSKRLSVISFKVLTKALIYKLIKPFAK